MLYTSTISPFPRLINASKQSDVATLPFGSLQRDIIGDIYLTNSLPYFSGLLNKTCSLKIMKTQDQNNVTDSQSEQWLSISYDIMVLTVITGLSYFVFSYYLVTVDTTLYVITMLVVLLIQKVTVIL